MIYEYGFFILSISILIELLLILILFARDRKRAEQFNQLLKNHGIMIRAMRRNGLLKGEDLTDDQ